ncbi:ribonuclease H-like domain-containing protein [Neobacillus dielmonensis]|uniref:ribonuclease H-like domain-containing protein n=1 Tax=Neobacillus dielmonensis TaxID=1347369 RepID=UPI0005AB8563|nr:ribonuclease H-like domain-containing protein [Neobacillus dielmonensis]
MSLKNKLNRLKPHLSVGAQPVHPVPKPEPPSIEIPFLEKWKAEHVVPYYFDDSYCLIREVVYPLDHKHGHYCFSDFLIAMDIWNREKINHPLSAKGFRAEELFFFDTETTGLGGGTGNTIFLLGYASISGDKLILRQHILPHPGAEVPLYQSFLERINYKTLVTYNGKSFDWPQVKTRHTLVREHVPKLPEFGHFDIYHAARRLWKHKLDRIKLTNVEQDVLGVERADDIPGYLAPMIYFDFIESKQPEGMLGILKHNEVDILSLVTLYTHLTFQLCGKDLGQTRKETYEVGRWFAALGETHQAERVLTKLTAIQDVTSSKAMLTLAYQHKKDHNYQKAQKLFLDAAESGGPLEQFTAYIELAIIYEHRIKDLQLAIEFCEKAMDLATKRKKTKSENISILEQLEKRYDRLLRKKEKS